MDPIHFAETVEKKVKEFGGKRCETHLRNSQTAGFAKGWEHQRDKSFKIQSGQRPFHITISQFRGIMTDGPKMSQSTGQTKIDVMILLVRNDRQQTNSPSADVTLTSKNERNGEFHLSPRILRKSKRHEDALKNVVIDRIRSLPDPEHDGFPRIQGSQVLLGNLHASRFWQHLFDVAALIAAVKEEFAARKRTRRSGLSGCEAFLETAASEPENLELTCMNLILYGPPGTGKTYFTRIKAAEIVNSTVSDAQDAHLLDDLRRDGQVKFITFHQSYSYEDFVEGIRPVLDNGGETTAPRYECRDGIFKQMAVEALFACLEGEGIGHLRDYPVRAQAIQRFLRERSDSGYALKSAGKQRRYVLVIDEVNRGNISKVFGELITLIEDDKRVGQENELVATLPYSGELFAVPPNLHIIGTMNSADKSIALVDLALRRRFEFQELRPDFSNSVCPKLSSEMRDCLIELNRRIVLRKDRDHCIGHAYFIRVHDDAQFNSVFERKIIPLLQEYFYNDWDGLRFVLGESGDDGKFIKKLQGSDERGTRTKWQWCFDAGEEISDGCLAVLGSNYGVPVA